MPREWGNRPAAPAAAVGQEIHLYGWDSRSETWFGPNELDPAGLPDRRLLHSLRATPGPSWYGRLSCCASCEPPARFFAMVHDLSDCAVALIYCDESKAGPAEIVAVLPPGRRPKLREEFAFEFLAFMRFLGSLGPGAEVRVHDEIAGALANSGDSETVVFSISSGLWPSDLDPVLSRCVERVAMALYHWQQPPGVQTVPLTVPAAGCGTTVNHCTRVPA